MSKIEVNGDVDAISIVDSIMQRLAELSFHKKCRVIRIGGDERWFDGVMDSVSAVNTTKWNGLAVVLDCNDHAYPLVIGVLKHLEKLSVDNVSRVIRIGGEEITFDGTRARCSVDSIIVDGRLNADPYVSSGRLNARSKNATNSNVVNPSVITPAPAPVVDNDVLDSVEADVISDIIDDKVGQGQMFTAYDITKELRSSGTRTYHRNTKEIVHALFLKGNMQGYTRSLVSVPNAPIKPFLYHPMGSDISTYTV